MSGRSDAVADSSLYLDSATRARLLAEHAVQCCTIVQRLGDIVLVPAMSPYQVCHLEITNKQQTCLTALCPGLPGWAGTRKTNLDFSDFNKARDSEWQWHQLGHMQVCTSLQTHNHASTPPLSHSVFLQAGCPSCRPTNSVKALKATEGLSPRNSELNLILESFTHESLSSGVFG